ncbi:MAG: hypothetical protein LBE91_06385 [Tannerella sp.]|nr:hypothetical protein [Tannerella sp.]
MGNKLILKKVDVRNCPNLTEPLDLSGCVNLEEVYAEGTNISMVVLPEAGVLHTLHLPASIVNLTLKNQTNLSPNPSPQGEGSGLVLAGTENIATLVLENMNQIEPWELLKSILSPLRGLNRVRLIGIDAEDSDLETLRTVAGLQGVDEHGLATARAVVTGKIFISGDIYQSEVDELNGVFPELEISGNILSDPVTTFTFTSNKSGETLGGTSFLCSHPFVKIDGTTFAVTAAPGTVISFTFSADKHQDRTANYTVTTSRTQGYSVIYLPLVTFTFRKTDNTPLEGVIASPQPPPKEGETLVSDANGQISFRATGLITGTAEHDYGKASINVTVSGQNDQAFTVVLQPFVQVRLRAIVENVPVRGAAITFNGQTYGTDYNGFTPSIRASAGSYESSCTYQGKMKTFGVYVGLSDSFTEVSMNNMQIAFSQMDFGEPDGSIQVILNTASAITVNSTNANYVIDWGEGKETAATGTGSQSYTPPAGLQQVKFVKIRNCGGITAMTFPAYSVMALLSVGDSKLDYAVTYGLSSSTFNNAFSNLRVTGSDVFKAGMAKPSVDFGSAFASRTSLLFVQAHLFDGLNVTNFQQAFHGCSLAESIPEGLFRDAVNCKNFNSAFFSFGNGNLAGLTLDPQDLFPAVPDANIGNLFNSSAIKRVRESLLAPFVSVISATAVFQNCTKLETAVIPAQIPVQANFFNGCTALEWVEFKHAAPFVLDASVFGNTNGTFVIYVPDSAVAAYKAEASWSGFVSRILPASQKTV